MNNFHSTGPPSSPKNLEVSDVSQSSCLLSWLPPEDDGGGPITTYHLEMCLIQDEFAGLKLDQLKDRFTCFVFLW